MSYKLETDDMLDFINSLPDTSTSQEKGSERKEDLLSFLDELAEHEKSVTSSTSKLEPKKKEKDSVEPVSNLEVEREQALTPKSDKKPERTEIKRQELAETEDSTGETTQDSPDGVKSNQESHEINIDPIGSLSSWWQSEGSSKVTSLWGTLTSNAQNIGEHTYQLATDTTHQLSQSRQKVSLDKDIEDQFGNLSNRVNSIFSKISLQIKQGLLTESDEILSVWLVSDFDNFKELNKLCKQLFDEVLGQVEGDLTVMVNDFNLKAHETDKIDLNMFHGKVIDGEKLCAANLDSAIKSVQKASNEELTNEIHQVPTSRIFISIQAISTHDITEKDNSKNRPTIIDANDKNSFAVTTMLKDIDNNVTLMTKSQPFPHTWYKWIKGDIEHEMYPDVDPGELVRNTLALGLKLNLSVLAQQYFIERMDI